MIRIFKGTEKTFLKTLDEIHSDLNKGKFDSAIALYVPLRKQFKKLKKNKKLEHQQEFDITIKQLLLYFYYVEALALTKSDNISRFRETLAKIKDIKNILGKNIPETLIEFAKTKEKEIKEYKSYWNTRHNFVNLYKNIIKSAHDKNLPKAIQNFRKLQGYYNLLIQYEDYENRLELYSRITKLRKLLSSVFSTPVLPKIIQPKKAEVVKKFKITKKLKPKNKKIIKPKPMPKSLTPEKRMEKLHEALKKGDYSKASDLYQQI